MSLMLTAGMDGEPEPVAGPVFIEGEQAAPKRYSERERLMLERRAAFFGRTFEEEVAYWEAVLSGTRLPDPTDLEVIQRLDAMRGKGLLPNQKLAKTMARLASVDRLPEGTQISCPVTVGDLCRVYLEYKLKASGSYSYAHVRRTVRHTMEQSGFDQVKLTELTPGRIRQWHAEMASRHVAANTGLKVLRAAFRFCQRLELLKEDPTVGVQRFREEARTRYIRPDEMPRVMYVLNTASPKYQAFFLTQLFTASRPREVGTMRWRDVDFVGMRWRKPTSKTGRPQEIVLNPVVYRLLRRLPALGEYVFPGKDLQKPMAECTSRKAWDRIRRVAEIPDVTVYDLRRTMGSWLANHGINLSTIQAALNHSTLQATHRYAHLDVQTAGRALDGITRHMVSSSPELHDLCKPLAPDELTPEARASMGLPDEVRAETRTAHPGTGQTMRPMSNRERDDEGPDWSEVPG
ncbi:MAG: hypothetical protein LZF60_160166 [Nitrospira sp.]|nr:MAG: hypothetical protein LZF60_160166 [Nitrospira sp.]